MGSKISSRNTPYGLIPNNWEFGSFSEYFQINPKVSIDKNSVYDFVEMAAVEPADRTPNYFFSVNGNKNGSKFIANDVIFARITPCTENGKIAIIDDLPNSDAAIGSTEFIVLRKKEKISDSNYLYYLVTWSKIRNFAISRMRGTSGRQRVPNDVFNSELSVPLPPLPEQVKIAAILTSVDNAIQATKKVIEKTKRLKKGLMQQLLTRGMPGWHTEFKEVTLGNYNYIIPKSSKLIKLRELPMKYNDNSLHSNTSSNYEFNYYSISNIGNGIIIDSPEVLNYGVAPSRARRLVEFGDLVLSSVRPNLRSKYFITNKIEFPAVFSTGFIVMRENKPDVISMKYLFYLFEHELLYSQIVRKSVGSNYPAITVKDVKSSSLILHSFIEQENIVKILSSIDNQIQSLKDNMQKIQKIKNGLMQKLLTGQIRVR